MTSHSASFASSYLSAMFTRNKKKEIKWIGHTLRKEDGEIPKAALLWRETGREEDREIAGEDR